MGLQVILVDLDVAFEIAALGDTLRDPVDRTIVATARVHRLTLVTSDQRIVASKLVPVID
jgi:PIN domain nuclease of toxin-antitoxin system